jgi:hypothetical protein
MKRFLFILGVVLMGAGLLVSLGTVLMMLDDPAKFTPTTHLYCWLVAGLLPLAIGTFMWSKSGHMRTGKAMWFCVGVVLSWFVWATVSHLRLRPRDYTASWSADQRDIAPEWLKHAKGRRLGGIMVFTPSDDSLGCALIHPPKPNHFPQIMFQDEDADGTPDSLLICDRLYRSFLIEDEDADGIFDSSQYTSGVQTDSVSVTDNNMDAEPDFRLGPGPTIAVTIDGRWYDLIHTNKKQFVEMDGQLTRVKATNGTWRVTEE